MWRYLLSGAVVITGFISVVALDDWVREPRVQPLEPAPITLKPSPPTPEPAPPPSQPLPVVVQPVPPQQQALVVPPIVPPLPPPIAVAPPAPIVTQPAAPPEKPKPRPKPMIGKPSRAPEPKLVPDEPPPPSVSEDVANARQSMSSGNYSEARQMLARIQTRLVLQPVTPEQPDRNDLNAAATMVGIAMQAIDVGDLRRASRLVNDICQIEHCASSGGQSAPTPRRVEVYAAPSALIAPVPPPPAPVPVAPDGAPRWSAAPAPANSVRRWSGMPND